MGLGLALDVAIINSTARVFKVKGLTLATLVHSPNNLGAKSVPSATGIA